MASPVVKEWVSAAAAAEQAPATVATSANVAVGDLLVCIHGNEWGTSEGMVAPTGTSGTWTQRAAGTRTGDNNAHVKAWTRIVGAAGVQTTTVNTNGGANVTVAVAVIDKDTFDPDTFFVGGAGGGSQATEVPDHVMPSVAGGAVGDLLIGAAMAASNGATDYSAPGGMTRVAEVDHSSGYGTLGVFTKTLTAAGATGDQTATANPARRYDSVSVVIRGAEPPPPAEGLLWAGDYAAVRTPAGYGFTNVQYQADGQSIVNNYTGGAIAGTSHPALGNSLYLTLNPDEGRIEATPPGGVSYFGEGADVYFRFDFVLDSNFEVNATNRHHALSQIHSASGTASPPLEFDVVDGGLYTRGASDVPEYNLIYRRLTDVAVGVKYSVIFRVRFSFTPANGLVEVWVNGTKVLSEVPTHAMLNGGGESYWKGATFYRSSAYTSTEGQWQSNHAIATTYAALADLDNGNDAAYGGGQEPLPTSPPDTSDALQARTVSELAGWHAWLADNDAVGFVGEYATVTKWADYGDTAQQAQWDALAEVYLDYADYARIHTAYWASGREFDAGYPLGLHVGPTQNTALSVAHSTSTTIAAHPSRHGVIRAVNLAGYENGVVINGGGTVRTATGFVHTTADFAFLAANGVDTVRLPLAWERLQPTLGGALSSTALTALHGMLIAARNNGIGVLVDPLHNYARYTLADGSVVSLGAGITNAQFADFWSRFSAWVRADPARNAAVLAYGLMNEPHDLTGGAATWEAASQAAVTAIRGGGDNRLLLVGGYTFSSLYEWRTWHPDGWITDPAGNFAYEAHHYWDSQTFNADGSPSPRSGQFQQSNGAGGHETMAYATELAAAEAALYRVNLCPNPSLETNVAGFSLGGVRAGVTVSAAVSRSNTIDAASGTWYGFINITGTGTTGTDPDVLITFPSFPVTAGQNYRLSWYRRPGGATGATDQLRLRWLNASGNEISSYLGDLSEITTGLWSRRSGNALAPAGAVTCAPQLAIFSPADTTLRSYRWDAVLYEQTTELRAYFDGDTTDASWDGTPHASTSRIPYVPGEDVARTPGDAIATTDTATRVASYAPRLTETAASGDTVTTASVTARAAGVDTAPAGDQMVAAGDYRKAFTDETTTIDGFDREGLYAREATDAAGLADSVNVSADRTSLDEIRVYDSVVAGLALAVETTDTIDVADTTPDYLLGAIIVVDDTIDVADQPVELEADYDQELGDTVGTVDEPVAAAGYDRGYDDDIGVADAAYYERGRSAHLDDTVDLDDTVSSLIARGATVTDAITVDDTAAQAAAAKRSTRDRAAVDDSVDVQTRGRVTAAAPPTDETDTAANLPIGSASMPVPVAIDTSTTFRPPVQSSAPAVRANSETDTVWTPRPTGSYPTALAVDRELTFTPVVLVDDGEFDVAINDADRVPVYVLKADWNRNGLFDHPLSDLTALVEEVTVSRALSGTLPAEVGLVEGYSSAELTVTLAGEINTVFDELDERRNLVLNPSFESNTLGWTSNGENGSSLPREQSASLSSGMITPRSGEWYAYTRRSTTGNLLVYPSSASPVTAMQDYVGSIFINRDGLNGVRLDIEWYNSSGTYLSSSLGTSATPASEVWAQLMVTGKAPGNATQGRIVMKFFDQAGGRYVRIDAALFERLTGVTAGSYFDGNSPGARWVGTVNNSVSIRGGAVNAPRAPGRELDVVDAFAPYRFDSPLYGRPLLQTPIYLETGFLADDGPRLARRFTGTVTRINPQSLARTVELSGMDPVNRLRATLSVPGVAMYESLLAKYGPDQYRSRMNSQWLIDYTLRRNGIFTSPPCRDNAILSVTGHGSMIPEVGWGGAPEEHYPTFRGDMWVGSRFGGAVAPVSGIGRWWVTEELTAASGTGFGISQWMALYPAGVSGVARQNLSIDMTTNASWFINFGVGTDGRPYLESRNVSGSTVRAVPTGFTPPSVGTWRFVGVHVTFTATQMTVRFRIAGTTYTSTVTIGSRPGNWKPGVHVRYNYATPFTNLQIWKSASAPAEPWQGEDPNWVPQADLDPGVNELTGIPELTGVDSWELIKQVTDAEGSTFQFDEYGRPQFRTSKGDQRYGRTKRVREVVSADRNLADLVSTTDESTIRNVINIKTKTQLVSDWQDFYVSPDVDAFNVPAFTTSYFEVNLPTAAYEIPPPLSTFGCRPSVPNCYYYAGGTGFIYYGADDGWSETARQDQYRSYIRMMITGVENPTAWVNQAVQIRVVRLSPWKMQIIINNQNNHGVRMATPATYDANTGAYTSMGEPALIIPARIVTEGVEQLESYTDNSSVALYGASSFDVGGSDDKWRQSPWGFRSLATEVLSTTASPVPVLDAVSVPHDPRRKLGDLLVLRDPDGLGEVTASIVALSQTYSSGGASDQITVRPVAPPV